MGKVKARVLEIGLGKRQVSNARLTGGKGLAKIRNEVTQAKLFTAFVEALVSFTVSPVRHDNYKELKNDSSHYLKYWRRFF